MFQSHLSGLVQTEKDFMQLKSIFEKNHEHLDPLSQTHSRGIPPPLIEFKEFEEKFEKLRIEHKKDLLYAISQNSAIDTGLKFKSILETHMAELKKEIQFNLSKQFHSHKKMMKEIIDHESLETQDWRQEIQDQISKLNVTLPHPSQTNLIKYYKCWM